MIDVLFTVRRASASILPGASRFAVAPSDAVACRSAAHVAPPAIVLSRVRECQRPIFDAETAQLGYSQSEAAPDVRRKSRFFGRIVHIGVFFCFISGVLTMEI